MISHANRGKSFETIIEKINAMYRTQGIAVIHKVPTEWIPIRRFNRIVSAKVTRKASVDFMGVAEGIPIAFDTKDCIQTKWITSNLHDHQRIFLTDWISAGGIGFVLLRLKNDVYIVTLETIKQKKTITREDGIMCGYDYLPVVLLNFGGRTQKDNSFNRLSTQEQQE